MGRSGVMGASAGLAIVLTIVACAQLPALGAGGLLHPARHIARGPAPARCVDSELEGDDVTLRGWRCRSAMERPRGTIVYLHGIADNRGSATGVVQRFTARGFDVIAYDSRAHGESGGDACTYGYFEKRDLHKVVDTIAAAPVILIGTSLGAAVALQEAADDPRIAAVVAAETFSDLRTVASERAPAFFTRGTIDRSFRLAEQQGRLRVDAVAPAAAASRISAPVLLIHGAADVETPPAHSERVFAALPGSKRLILVPGARHNQSLNSDDTWKEIELWIDGVLAAPGVGAIAAGTPGAETRISRPRNR